MELENEQKALDACTLQLKPFDDDTKLKIVSKLLAEIGTANATAFRAQVFDTVNEITSFVEDQEAKAAAEESKDENKDPSFCPVSKNLHR